MIYYIKFRHPNDVYAIEESYDLSPDDFIPPKVCGRCGENLYIPVNLPANTEIVQPLPEVIKPLPKENPHLIFLSEPEPMTLEFTYQHKLNFPYPYYSEIARLKSFPSVSYADENGFSMLIDGVSKGPIKHICNDLVRGD